MNLGIQYHWPAILYLISPLAQISFSHYAGLENGGYIPIITVTQGIVIDGVLRVDFDIVFARTSGIESGYSIYDILSLWGYLEGILGRWLILVHAFGAVEREDLRVRKRLGRID